GPEPWTEPRSATATVLALVLAFLVLGVAGGWLWRDVRRRRMLQRSPAEDLGTSSEGSMALWSAQVRGALIAGFGPAWGAKTTEEIAAEPVLAELLGLEQAGRLVRFLRAADRAKFAGETAVVHSPEWGVWVSAFVAEAGA